MHDQGPGLIAAQQEHFRERFYRVAGVEVRIGSGMGLELGLRISKTIIEAHHDQVGVESASGTVQPSDLPSPGILPAKIRQWNLESG